MLRARMPDRFKAPGASVQVNAGAGANLLVIGPEEQAQLVANRRKYSRPCRLNANVAQWATRPRSGGARCAAMHAHAHAPL